MTEFSETQLDQLQKAVRSATEPVVAEDGRVRPALPTADERQAAKELRAMLDRSEALTKQVEAVSARLSWDSDKWLKAALVAVPYVVALVMLVALAVPLAAVVGVPTLSAWAWASFGAAESVWGRGLIAVATLAVIAAVVYGVYRGGKWLAGKYEAAIR